MLDNICVYTLGLLGLMEPLALSWYKHIIEEGSCKYIVNKVYNSVNVWGRRLPSSYPYIQSSPSPPPYPGLTGSPPFLQSTPAFLANKRIICFPHYLDDCTLCSVFTDIARIARRQEGFIWWKLIYKMSWQNSTNNL